MSKRHQDRGAGGDPGSRFAFLEEDPGTSLSVFEFLDDEEAPPGSTLGAADAAPLPYAPIAPCTPWEAMDADYRLPPGPPVALHARDLLGRPVAPDVLVRRARLEGPILCTWLMLTCLAPSAWGGAVLGIALIGFSVYIRVPLRLCGLQGQAGVYRAIGAGQGLFALSTILGLGALAPPLAAYGLAVLLSWAFVECRQLYYMERDAGRGRYPAPYHY